MLNTLRIFIVFTMLAVAGSVAHAEDYKQIVEGQYEAFDQAFNAQDGEAIAKLYTNDALFLPSSHEVIEQDGIAKFFEGLFEAGITDHKIELIEIVEARDGTIIAAGRWHVKAPGEDGEPTDVTGLLTHVFKLQENGNYLARLHIFN
ncbi:MAG: YybH family protein [Methyloligella sp. ZOD6]